MRIYLFEVYNYCKFLSKPLINIKQGQRLSYYLQLFAEQKDWET